MRRFQDITPRVSRITTTASTAAMIQIARPALFWLVIPSPGPGGVRTVLLVLSLHEYTELRRLLRAPARGALLRGCLAQLYDAPLVAVRERLLGMPERIELQEALCSNCNERRVTYRHRAA
jgi:hypothetical protein